MSGFFLTLRLTTPATSLASPTTLVASPGSSQQLFGVDQLADRAHQEGPRAEDVQADGVQPCDSVAQGDDVAASAPAPERFGLLGTGAVGHAALVGQRQARAFGRRPADHDLVRRGPAR
ncbi:MAG: hypothetical protein WDN24_07110 [Sphingomonas sp.]